MTEKTLIIAILVALILLWFAETLGMHKTSRILGGAIDLGFAVLRQLNSYILRADTVSVRYFFA